MVRAAMTRSLCVWSCLGVFLLSGACSRREESQSSATTGASSPLTASASPAGSAAPARSPSSGAHDVTWADPVGWQRLAPSNSMRKATYKIPAEPKDPEDAEMAVFYFGRDEGGSTEANIQRWIAQFGDAKPGDVKRTERSANGMKQTLVELEGTYSGSGMPGTPTTHKAAYRLLGAVVETPLGSYFFKMTGPKKTIEAARGACLTMLDSVKAS
jgi:hypothetical protein